MHRSAPITPLLRRRPRGIPRSVPLIAALLTAASLLAPGVAASAASATTTPADQWTALGGDGANSGTNAGEHVLTAASASKVRKAWTNTTTVGTYPPVVLSGVVYSIGQKTSGATVVPQLEASSPTTGAVLWTLKLPGSSWQYDYGMAGSGHTVLVAYRSEPGSVLAIDTSARRIAWQASFPPSTIAGSGDDYPGVPSTDGTRVYIAGSSNAVNVYSLATGARLWSLPVTFNSNGTENTFSQVAASGGVVYATTEVGLVAVDAGSGKKVWSGSTNDAFRQPVVAGGRVLVTTQSGVASYPAAGCGKAVCSPTWTRAIPTSQAYNQTISSADASNVFVTSEITPTGSVECDIRSVGTVTRLSASTGAVQWTQKVGDFTTGLVRGGDTVWLLNEYRSTANGCAEEDRILGYSVKATGATPAGTVNLPSALWGFPQSLAVASGTLFEAASSLIGYRIPNT